MFPMQLMFKDVVFSSSPNKIKSYRWSALCLLIVLSMHFVLHFREQRSALISPHGGPISMPRGFTIVEKSIKKQPLISEQVEIGGRDKHKL